MWKLYPALVMNLDQVQKYLWHHCHWEYGFRPICYLPLHWLCSANCKQGKKHYVVWANSELLRNNWCGWMNWIIVGLFPFVPHAVYFWRVWSCETYDLVCLFLVVKVAVSRIWCWWSCCQSQDNTDYSSFASSAFPMFVPFEYSLGLIRC